MILPKRLTQVGYTCKAVESGILVTVHTSTHLQQGASKNFLADTKGTGSLGAYCMDCGGPHRDNIRRSQHGGKDNGGAGAISSMRRPKTNVIDHKSIRHNDDGTLTYEHITMDNATHSTDAFAREQYG